MPDFKQAKRKNLKATASKIDYIRLQLNGVKDAIIERAGGTQFDNIINTLNETVEQIEDEIKSLPLRHEYRGTFYIRKPYTQPLQSIKVEEGIAKMREDIATWEVRDKDNNYIVGTRDIFRDDGLTDCITREEGTAIFDQFYTAKVNNFE